MKLVTVGLAVVGVIAAASAAVLVASMQDGPVEQAGKTQSTIVVATRDLSGMTTVEAGDLETRTIDSGLAPAGALGDPVQCVGRMLTATVLAGQALTEDAFMNDGSISRLAASLPAGRRAVSVTLGDNSSVSLLYPGCVVDVLATMRITRSSGSQHPVTVTLLQAVTVLAVGSQTIVSPAAGADAEGTTPSYVDRPSVALLADSHQAEMLRLAMQEGSLSLVLRNPNDADLSSAMGADMAALVPQPAETQGPMPQPAPMLAPEASPTIFQPQQQTWEATVLRGNERENRTFVLPASTRP